MTTRLCVVNGCNIVITFQLICALGFLSGFLLLVVWFYYLIFKNRRVKTYYGYVLKDGRKTFYVGQTTNRKRRLAQHIRSADRYGTLKQRYIWNMLRKGKRPTMRTIKKTRDKETINAWERKHIPKWGTMNTIGR